MAELDALFRKAVENNASDIHLSPGEPYIMRKFGSLEKLQDDILSADRCKQLVNELLDQDQQTKLLNDLQLDFAYEIEGLGRFRGSAMMHRNGLSDYFQAFSRRFYEVYQCSTAEKTQNLLLISFGHVLWRELVD